MTSPEASAPASGLDGLRAQVEARTQEEAERLAAAAAEKAKGAAPEKGGPDDPKFVLDCLANNERGDGVLFAALHRGRFLHNKATGTWLRWDEHHWAPDKMNEATAGVEAVALTYRREAGSIGEEIRKLEEARQEADEKARECKRAEDTAGEDAARAEASRLANDAERAAARRQALNKRIDRLRSVRGAANCLTWSHCIDNPLAIIGDEIDKRPLLLPCANGVIDLETGELRPGDPADLLVRAIPVAYRGIDHVNEDWDKFIQEIHVDGTRTPDPELAAFVRRLLGYCLTGLTTEHFIACFLGEGANGKGTLFEVLREVMGELSWAIEPEMLLEQKNSKSSAGPSPDVISLHGRRLVVASETDQNRRISAARVKRYTGGDTLIGRSPHDKYEINFQPSHKIVLYTNHPPKGLASDFGLFRRLLYLWYPLRYVEDVEAQQKRDPQNAALYRRRDVGLKARLLEDPEGILAWLVRGCLEWQRLGGLKPPPSILAAAEAIRRDEDHLERFLEAVCSRVGAEQQVAFKYLYDQFGKWFAENVDEDKRYIPSKKAVGDQLRRKGYRMETVGGSARVYGLDVREVTG